MCPPNGWVPSRVTQASSSCPAVTAAGMATLWLLLSAAKLVSATSSTSGNCASARGVAWQPSHVAPPSVVIVTIIRSEEHTSELQSLMRISYAVFCLKKKNSKIIITYNIQYYLSQH